MKEVSLHIGSRIRLYRKAKKLTLLELSEKIHKSKATLSKYETGDITIDIETLFDIADVLGVKVQQLIDYIPEAQAEAPQKNMGAFFPQRRTYVYFYDGRFKRIVRNILEIDQNAVTFYYDIASFDDPENCRNLFFGSVEYFDTFTNFSLESQSNRMENATLCAVNPLDRGAQVLGLLSGISRYPILPISIKCIISPELLEENEELKEKLLLSKKDVKMSKTLNMFAVEQID